MSLENANDDGEEIKVWGSAGYVDQLTLYRRHESQSDFVSVAVQAFNTSAGTFDFHDDQGLVDGTYEYYVEGTGEYGSDESETVSVNFQEPPDYTPPPEIDDLSATPQNKAVKLTWSRTSGDTEKYRVYRSTSSGQRGSRVATVNESGANESWNDTGVSDNTTYYYSVRAGDDSGNWNNGENQAQATPIDGWAPGSPSSLTATGEVGQIKLDWNGVGASDLDGYNVYRSTSPFSGKNGDQVASDVNGTSWTDHNRPDNQTFYYRVTAEDVNGNESGASNRSSAKTIDVTPPAIPSGLVVEGERTFKLDLAWESNTEDDFDGYNLYRAQQAFDSPGAATKVNDDLLTVTELTDSGLELEQDYHYRLTAVDINDNESDLSDEAVGTPHDVTPPGQIDGLTAEGGDERVGLEWEAGSEADLVGYNLYRADAEFDDKASATLVNEDLHLDVTFEDLSVQNEIRYRYRVAPVDTAGNEGQLSEIAEAFPEDTIPPVAPPLTITPSDEALEASWETVDGTDAIGYNVYVADQPFDSLSLSAAERVNSGLVSGNTYDVEDLDYGTEYFVAVTAIDEAGNESTGFEPRSDTPADRTPPPVPAAIAGEEFDRRLEIRWEPSESPDFIGYELYRAESDFTSVEDASKVHGGVLSDTAFVDKGLPNGTEQFYHVVAVDTASNRSSISPVWTGLPGDNAAPDVPGKPHLTPGSKRITLDWSASDSSDVEGYNIYRASDPIAERSDGVRVNGNDLVAETTYDDGDLADGTRYYYRITAVDDNGNESALSEQSSRRPADNKAPNAPREVVASAEDGAVNVSWNGVRGGDLDGYFIYRFETSGSSKSGMQASSGVQASSSLGKQNRLNSEAQEDTVYVDRQVENGSVYEYRITAIDTTGNESPPSQRATAAPNNDVYYVSTTSKGEGDGSSWANASTLPPILAKANENDEVWIQEGVYAPESAAGDDVVSFSVAPGVRLYGGFSGAEERRNERSPNEHLVVLSGDIGGDDERTSSGVTDRFSDQEGNNAHHVLTVEPGTKGVSTIIDGLTITAGQANGEGTRSKGGGIFCDGATQEGACEIALVNAHITGNKAEEGGGIFVSGSESVVDLVNVDLAANRAGAQGAGLALAGARSRIVNVNLLGNEAGQEGGAVYFRKLTNQSTAQGPQIYNSTIAGNSAGVAGAVLFNQGGSNVEVGNSILAENDSPGSVITTPDGSVSLNHALTSQNLVASSSGVESESKGDGSSAKSSEGGVVDFGNNLVQDAPRFVDGAGTDGVWGTEDDDVRLKEESTAINGGSNDLLPNDWLDLDGDGNRSEPLPMDVRGKSRRVAFIGEDPQVDLGAIEMDEAILPVIIKSFNGEGEGRTAHLSWETEKEINNLGFEVQREGEDGFTSIGSVVGNGTSKSAHAYNFTDEGAPYEAEQVTYRLKQLDTDSTARYTESITVELDLPETLELFGNYPNPFRGQTTIRYRVPKKAHVRLSVYNTLGQRVALLVDERQNAGRNEITFDGGPLPSGTYFVNLEASGKNVTKRMTIVR